MDETGVRRQSRRTGGQVAMAGQQAQPRARRLLGEEYPPGTKAVVKKENGTTLPLVRRTGLDFDRE